MMITRKEALSLAIVIFVMLLLGACAGTEVRQKPSFSTENPSMQVHNLEIDVEKARQQQVDVLVPLSFAKAELSLNEAKQALQRGDAISKILEKVTNSRMYLQRAEQKTEISKTALKDVIDARERARAAGAVALKGDYQATEELFLNLTRAVEKNDLGYAQKNSLKTIQAFDELEVRAIKFEMIGKAREMINKAEIAGAAKIVPEAYTIAKNKLIEADLFISSNRYEKAQIHEKADGAVFYATRLTKFMAQAMEIEKLNPEQITLWIEEILYETAKKLSMPDMRDKDFKTQHNEVLNSIGNLQYDYSTLTAKLDNQHNEINSMKQKIVFLEGRTREEELAKTLLVKEEQDAKRRLEEERRFNQLFNEIRMEFGPTEAEVYKQGNSLVIRLKSIQFPVGKAFLKPSNYAMLSKIQDVVRKFREPEMVIEGHTDSVGSDEMNKKLSQERANAVREYFIANGPLPREAIYAIGYGSFAPLASNETNEGRAINRRIDVIITPKTPADE